VTTASTRPKQDEDGGRPYISSLNLCNLWFNSSLPFSD
jgi:hypothetical protein